jgi:alanyl-tRNA synthetase
VTERLYYTDPYLAAFEAEVTAVRELGERTAVVLDRTAFYPTSGGQPHDVGTLGAARVIDVIDGDGGEILHVLDGAVPAGKVTGRIDWQQRFEHMQQHTRRAESSWTGQSRRSHGWRDHRLGIRRAGRARRLSLFVC